LKLGKLEALHATLEAARTEKIRLRRTLAGALITLSGGQILVERAPPRSGPARKNLTTRQHRPGGRPERRSNDTNGVFSGSQAPSAGSVPLADASVAHRLGSGTDLNRQWLAGNMTCRQDEAASAEHQAVGPAGPP